MTTPFLDFLAFWRFLGCFLKYLTKSLVGTYNHCPKVIRTRNTHPSVTSGENLRSVKVVTLTAMDQYTSSTLFSYFRRRFFLLFFLLIYLFSTGRDGPPYCCSFVNSFIFLFLKLIVFIACSLKNSQNFFM